MTQQKVPLRLRSASGSSAADDSARAGREAATEALECLDGEEPALVIVYASVRYQLPTLIAAIRAVTGDVPLVGETSTGHFRDDHLTQPGSGVSVLVMTGGPYRFGVAHVEHLSSGAEAAGVDLARAARAAIGPEPSPYAAVLIFADGLGSDPQGLVAGLHWVTGAAVPIIGGAASDDRKLNRTFVFHDDRVLTDAVVAVWIDADRPIPVTVGHGWHAIGHPLLVTKTDGLIVREIAGRPAREVFEEEIRYGNIDDLDQIRDGGYYSSHAFGLIEPDGTHLIRGVYMGEDGAIRTFAPLPDYSAVQVVGCNSDALLARSGEVVANALADRDASLLLVFSCVARLDILGDRGAEEARHMRAAAGDVPIFGIYTYGEFARTTSVAGYHNATIATVAL